MLSLLKRLVWIHPIKELSLNIRLHIGLRYYALSLAISQLLEVSPNIVDVEIGHSLQLGQLLELLRVDKQSVRAGNVAHANSLPSLRLRLFFLHKFNINLKHGPHLRRYDGLQDPPILQQAATQSRALLHRPGVVHEACRAVF